MPIYEFECECGKKTEKLCQSTDTIGIRCECGKMAKKVMSAAGWSLKGEGWYRTTNPKTSCNMKSGFG